MLRSAIGVVLGTPACGVSDAGPNNADSARYPTMQRFDSGEINLTGVITMLRGDDAYHLTDEVPALLAIGVEVIL